MSKLVAGHFSSKEARVERETTPVNENDSRSPLERWRTRPRKALSVTDLVSPSWCELQYFYTLKYHGRKRRTVAMKEGSVVHQTLEEQVHTTVKVDIETKEDAWGLRIWNVIQGLRSLMEGGQTRELEVWGIVGGQVVNGVIDEISYICPDEQMEEKMSAKAAKSKDAVPADQPSITNFFKSSSTTNKTTPPLKRNHTDKIYLCDVKTRAGRSLPTGAAFRPTQYQLMVYHRLLSNLATNTVDFNLLAERYALAPDAPFSDSFIAQIGSLDNDTLWDPPPSSVAAADEGDNSVASIPSSQDSITTLLAHNSLTSLWKLMIHTLQIALPNGRDSLGNVLKAEYRSRSTGEVLGRKTFAMDEGILDSYVEMQMEWWKGEREPVGVQADEAFKCRSCDFAENCEWRLGKLEEDRLRARRNRKGSEGKVAVKREARASTAEAEAADTDEMVSGGVMETKIPEDRE